MNERAESSTITEDGSDVELHTSHDKASDLDVNAEQRDMGPLVEKVGTIVIF